MWYSTHVFATNGNYINKKPFGMMCSNKHINSGSNSSIFAHNKGFFRPQMKTTTNQRMGGKKKKKWKHSCWRWNNGCWGNGTVMRWVDRGRKQNAVSEKGGRPGIPLNRIKWRDENLFPMIMYDGNLFLSQLLPNENIYLFLFPSRP